MNPNTEVKESKSRKIKTTENTEGTEKNGDGCLLFGRFTESPLQFVIGLAINYKLALTEIAESSEKARQKLAVCGRFSAARRPSGSNSPTASLT